MSDPRFFATPRPTTLAEIASATGSELRGDGDRVVTGIAPVERAGPDDLSFLDNIAYLDAFRATRAGGCVVQTKFEAAAPPGLSLLIADDPYRVFALAAAALYPAAMAPTPVFEDEGVVPGAFVHPDARLEAGVHVDPGAVVGPRAEIGSGTVIAANAVIGPDVRIGRQSAIGAGASVLHALIGNRVIIHPGARIGQDGFGFAMGAKSHVKVPQIGRVIVQDDVEIGAGSCIDRGSTRDTIIGEGTKIDNLVQVAHNVVIGRHCVIVAQTGISGSTRLGDFVVLGGQVGTVGHIEIGDGAQIAAQSGVMRNVPSRARWAGSPAEPIREWLRGVAQLRRLAAAHDRGPGKDADGQGEQS